MEKLIVAVMLTLLVLPLLAGVAKIRRLPRDRDGKD